MKEKEIKKEVKTLAKQKEFEQIYQQYGPQYFRKYVSRKFRKEDLKKLKREGKYLDIYERYGEKVLDYLYIYCKDIENEVGKKRSIPMKIIYECIDWLKSIVILNSVVALGFAEIYETNKMINSQKYAEEIEEYKDKVKEYSKKFDIHRQSDMKIIMRMIKDMHETIRGYGKPKIDALGYRGMDVIDEEGIGVCRNMAPSIVDKLNAVNPEYNARIVSLYEKTEGLEEAKIEHNLIDGNVRTNIKGNIKRIYIDERILTCIINTEEYYKQIDYDNNGNITRQIMANQENQTSTFYKNNGDIDFVTIIKEGYKTTKYYDEKGKEIKNKKERTDENNIFLRENTLQSNLDEQVRVQEIQEVIWGNHVVVAVDIKKDNVTLIIDPTNSALGFFKDGEIRMFNEKQQNEAIYDKRFFGNIKEGGIKAVLEYPIDYIKSFKEPNLSMEELEEKYGLEAQNKMLEEIEREDEKENQEKRKDVKTFKQDYKIDKGITYNFDTNTVTMTPEARQKEEETRGY